MRGETQDPVPAAVGGRVAGSTGASAASGLTPNLEWDMTIRFQRGTGVPWLTRAVHAVHPPFNFDVAAHRFPMPRNYGGAGNLVYGTITLRRFPSYIVYVTIDGGSGIPVTIPHYFAEASGRSLGAIAVGQTDLLRQLTF